jgi:hypothetical protein
MHMRPYWHAEELERVSEYFFVFITGRVIPSIRLDLCVLALLRSLMRNRTEVFEYVIYSYLPARVRACKTVKH